MRNYVQVIWNFQQSLQLARWLYDLVSGMKHVHDSLVTIPKETSAYLYTPF